MKITKVLLVSSITNIFLSIIKILFGFIGKCNALIADGIHSLSDLSTDFVAIFGNHLSLKPADKKHPFGHGKTEYITSVIIGIVIILLGLSLIYNIFNKEITIPNLLMILVSLFTIISKYILSSYIYKKGIEYSNNILIASGKESKADVNSSIFVLISIVLMQFSNELKILKYADMLSTVIISLFIIKTGFNILKDNIGILLEEQVLDKEYIKEIKNIITSFNEIVEIKDLYILRYGPYFKLVSNVIMKDLSLTDAHKIIDEIEKKLKEKDDKIKYVFIHMEPQI
ncbi:MAG TPA: cation transporter [Candidatus Faecisoma merdavium]|nr:cation transporter [Candidatus Faecisoma merdavium]